MNKNRKLFFTFILFLLPFYSLKGTIPLPSSDVCKLFSFHLVFGLMIAADKLISKKDSRVQEVDSSCTKLLHLLDVSSPNEALEVIMAIDSQYTQEQELLKQLLHQHYLSVAQTLNSLQLQEYINEVAAKDPQRFLSSEGIAEITKTINIVIKQRQLEMMLLSNHTNILHETVAQVSAAARHPSVTVEQLKKIIPQSVPQPTLLSDLSEKEYKKLTGQE